jgi:uncharacterized membrane protein (Fun14 family)
MRVWTGVGRRLTDLGLAAGVGAIVGYLVGYASVRRL